MDNNNNRMILKKRVWRKLEDMNRESGLESKHIISIWGCSYSKVTGPAAAAAGSTGAAAGSTGAAASPGFCPSLHPSPP